MAKINPKAKTLITNYINELPEFSKEICEQILKIIHKSNPNIIEDWKWNIPIFHSTSMLCGFGAFKKHVSITFFNGAIMSDKHQLFSDNCNARKTRSIKIENIEQIDSNKLLDYFKESFSLSEINTKSNTISKKEIIVPELLQKALNKNSLAKENFDNMAYTYRKEYAFHISDAKREATKINRLEKVILNLEQNLKMHEKYKC